jgi:hypothetical protein
MILLNLHHALDYVLAHWHVIVAYVGGGLTISVVLQIIKRHFHLDRIQSRRLLKLVRVDGARIVVMVLTIFTTIGTAVNWLIDPVNAQYLPKQFAFLLAAAFFVHRFAVSPIGAKIEKALKPYWMALEQIKETENRKMALAPPPLAATVTPSTPLPAIESAAISPFTLPQEGGK